MNKATQWINSVLSHETDDHIHNSDMVTAMARLVTLVGRDDLALVLKAYAEKK